MDGALLSPGPQRKQPALTPPPLKQPTVTFGSPDAKGHDGGMPAPLHLAHLSPPVGELSLSPDEVDARVQARLRQVSPTRIRTMSPLAMPPTLEHPPLPPVTPRALNVRPAFTPPTPAGPSVLVGSPSLLAFQTFVAQEKECADAWWNGTMEPLLRELRGTAAELETFVEKETEDEQEVEARYLCLERKLAMIELEERTAGAEYESFLAESKAMDQVLEELNTTESVVMTEAEAALGVERAVEKGFLDEHDEYAILRENVPVISLIHHLQTREDLLRDLEDRILLFQSTDDSQWAVNAATSASDFLSSGYPKGVTRLPVDSYPSVKPVVSVNEPEKLRFLIRTLSECSREADLLDEFSRNLRTRYPPKSAAHKREVLVRFSYGARVLAGRKEVIRLKKRRPLLKSAELLVLWLYTAHGVDIDAFLGFEVPAAGDVNGRRAYVKRYKTDAKCDGRLRNGCVFAEVNWALREIGGQGPAASAEAMDVARRWPVFIIVLRRAALLCQGAFDLATHNVPYNPRSPSTASTVPRLFRGFGGLPHGPFAGMTSVPKGAVLTWPAFTSCAVDRSVSLSYIDGSAANAAAKKGHAVLFEINDAVLGCPLQHISQYPEEKEVVLPPMTFFAVLSSEGSPEIKSKCVEGMRRAGVQGSADGIEAKVVRIQIDDQQSRRAAGELDDIGRRLAEEANDRIAGVLRGVDPAVLPGLKQHHATEVLTLERELFRLQEKKRRSVTRAVELRQRDAKNLYRETLCSQLRDDLEEALKQEQELLRNAEIRLLDQSGMGDRFGWGFDAAMLYLKGLVINLCADWAFIGNVHRTVSKEAAADGVSTSFRYIQTCVSSACPDCLHTLRWPEFSYAIAVRSAPSDELVSAYKQLVTCYDMIDDPKAQAVPFSQQILFNMDHLTALYNAAVYESIWAGNPVPDNNSMRRL